MDDDLTRMSSCLVSMVKFYQNKRLDEILLSETMNARQYQIIRSRIFL